jgi:hypothetical protein
MLQLSTKRLNSASNAQVSRVGAAKIYVAAAVEALKKKERQDETQFTTKIVGFLSFTTPPPLEC